MIKVLNQYFPGRLFVLLATENILILLIWMAVSVQFGTWNATAHHILILKAFVATAICQLCLYYADVYDLRSMETRAEVFFRLLQALGIATLLLAVLFLVFPDLGLNDYVVVASIAATVLILLLWRLMVDGLTRAYARRETVLLVGSSVAARELVREVKRRPELPIEFLGTVSESEERTV